MVEFVSPPPKPALETAHRSVAPAPSDRRARVLPAVLVLALLALAVPSLGFLLPNTVDETVESVEPLQTFRYLRSFGTATDPWGPLPHLLYALPYGALLAWWRLQGDFPQASFDYPYGFVRPHEQLGDLILSARWVGLLAVAVGLVGLYRALGRASGSRLAAALAVGVSTVGSPELAIALGTTKPDALMLAFFALALAEYALILEHGANRQRALRLVLCSVASISCKMLTAPVLAAMCLAVWWLPDASGRRAMQDRRHGWAALSWGALAYFLLNVAPAPLVWLESMQVALFGKLIDADIWAAPEQTLRSFLFDGARGMLETVGTLAGLALLAAFAWSMLRDRRRAFGLWLPFFTHGAAVVLIAGYMPSYFLSPLAIAACLPVAYVLARALAARRGLGLATALSAMVVLHWLSACAYMSAHRAWHPSRLCEDFARQAGAGRSLVRLNLWGNHPGSSRLAYLGVSTDERALDLVLHDPGKLPELIVVDRAHWKWVQDLTDRPARAAMLLEESGHDYRGGVHLGEFGYREAPSLGAELPPAWVRWLQPRSLQLVANPLLVFSREG